MEIWLIALTVLLPILKFVLFPARTIGRGGSWTIVGAIMIVAMMMALWFGMQSLTDTVGAMSPSTGKPSSEAAAQQSAEIKALSNLFK